MTEAERTLASRLLDVAANEFHEHGCNDMDPEYFEDLPESDVNELVAGFNAWRRGETGETCGHPEDDWILLASIGEDMWMAYLAAVIGRAEAQVGRVRDLLRFARGALHQEGLISDAEYADLVSDHAAVERLESYDAAKAEVASLREQLEEWRSWWGCDSPHDSHVQEHCVLGKEQARANRAENELDSLRDSARRLGEIAAEQDAELGRLRADNASLRTLVRVAREVMEKVLCNREGCDGVCEFRGTGRCECSACICVDTLAQIRAWEAGDATCKSGLQVGEEKP